MANYIPILFGSLSKFLFYVPITCVHLDVIDSLPLTYILKWRFHLTTTVIVRRKKYQTIQREARNLSHERNTESLKRRVRPTLFLANVINKSLPVQMFV